MTCLSSWTLQAQDHYLSHSQVALYWLGMVFFGESMKTSTMVLKVHSLTLALGLLANNGITMTEGNRQLQLYVGTFPLCRWRWNKPNLVLACWHTVRMMATRETKPLCPFANMSSPWALLPQSHIIRGKWLHNAGSRTLEWVRAFKIWLLF